MKTATNLDNIENLIQQEKFEEAQNLLQITKLNELTQLEKTRCSFLLAKVYFEQDMDDLVMPTLQNVFEHVDEFAEIDRAYLVAAVFHVFKAEGKEAEEKHADLSQGRAFFDLIKNPEKLSSEEQNIYYFQRGLLELASNQLKESIRYFKTALKVPDPGNGYAALHGYLADTYTDLMEYEQAIHHYDLAIENSTESQVRSRAFFQIDKARILDTIGSPMKASSIAFDLLKEFEDDAEISMYANGVLGYAFYSKKEFKESLKYFKQALELAKALGTDTTHYLFECSAGYRFVGDFKTAEKFARDALAETSDDTYIQLIYVEFFRQYMYSDRYEKAIEMLQILVEKYPDYENLGWVYRMIGHMHSLLDKHREAIVFFTKSLNVLNEDDEDRISALDFSAYCYLKLDCVDKAMQICFKIIEEYPERPNLAWTHAVLARGYFEKGMKIEAREHAEKAQQHKPPESEVYSFSENVLADILKDLGIE